MEGLHTPSSIRSSPMQTKTRQKSESQGRPKCSHIMLAHLKFKKL